MLLDSPNSNRKPFAATEIAEKETRISRRTRPVEGRLLKFAFGQHNVNGRRLIIPWLGILALLASATTCFLSWLVLHLIDHRVQIHQYYLKPASWLSLILSANSIFLHIALTEGLTVAWWYNASRSEAKVIDLHEIWAQGTSFASVLLSGRRINYVALATIFGASIPLNGILLQNAITVVPSIYVNQTGLLIGFAPSLPVGFSANFDRSEEKIGPIADKFAVVEGLVAPGSQWAAINAYPSPVINPGACGMNDTTGICTGRVNGTGFHRTCTIESVKFDLLPASHGAESFSARVFASNVTWNSSEPNVIYTTWLYKDDPNCIGSLTVYRCKLVAAKVSYPLQVFSGAQLGGSSAGFSVLSQGFGDSPFVSLNVNSTFQDDKIQEVLPVYPNEGITNTTYGGIAAYLAAEWDSSIDWTWNGSAWSVQAVGTIAKTLPMDNILTDGDDSSTNATPDLRQPGYCNNTFDGVDPGDENGSLILTMWGSLRNFMFFCNTAEWIYGSNPPDTEFLSPPQNIIATRTAPVLRYDIVYRWWAASLAVNLAIITVITTSFYGFWTLTHRPSLSPAETAAAFHASLVETEAEVHGRGRLKLIGERYVHMQQI